MKCVFLITTGGELHLSRLFILALLCLLPLSQGPVTAQPVEGNSVDVPSPVVDVQTIIDKVDKLYRSETSYSEIEMTIVNPNWERRLKVQMWSRGMEETFIRILSPKRDAGITTLRRDREMWNYFPKIDKVMKVPPSMMMGSWMGSDFTNDDLVKESTFHDDYNSRLIPADERAEDSAASNTYAIELTPKEKTATVWGRIVLVVRRSDYIPVSEVYYDERGRMMRRMELHDIAELGGRPIPQRLSSYRFTRRITARRFATSPRNSKLISTRTCSLSAT